MEAGTYKAKITNYGVTTSQKGAPQIEVVFAIDGGGFFTWFGGLGSAKQQEYTAKTLMTLGANAGNIDKAEGGMPSGVLDTKKVFELVIESKEYNGKSYLQIKYINDPSSPGVSQKVYLSGTGALSVLKGAAAQIAAMNGTKTQAQTDTVPF
jgi:hypothetical protein